jgi:hypothetical protein
MIAPIFNTFWADVVEVDVLVVVVDVLVVVVDVLVDVVEVVVPQAVMKIDMISTIARR